MELGPVSAAERQDDEPGIYRLWALAPPMEAASESVGRTIDQLRSKYPFLVLWTSELPPSKGGPRVPEDVLSKWRFRRTDTDWVLMDDGRVRRYTGPLETLLIDVDDGEFQGFKAGADAESAHWYRFWYMLSSRSVSLDVKGRILEQEPSEASVRRALLGLFPVLLHADDEGEYRVLTTDQDVAESLLNAAPAPPLTFRRLLKRWANRARPLSRLPERNQVGGRRSTFIIPRHL